jgi:hypothetical protein
MGTPASEPPTTCPYTSALLLMDGSTCIGMPSASAVGACHVQVRKSIRPVREAFVTSVMCTPPPVRLYTSHESMVPNAARPSATASATSGECSSIHRSL